jgi:hypothetical protein
VDAILADYHNADTLHLRVHTLRSLLASIGAEDLNRQISDIEANIKQDIDQVEVIKAFRVPFMQLINEIKKAINKKELHIVEECIEDDHLLIKLLSDLKRSLQSGFINEIHQIQDELKSIWVPEDQKLAYDQLNMAIKKYKFDAAQVLISAIIEGLGGNHEEHTAYRR